MSSPLIATAAGYAGFFHLVPGADIFLANDRVSATFKDPNVYGPFLIFPLLLLSIDFMTRRLRLTGLAILVFLIGGLLLSFSRGAWAHFAISAAVTIALLLAAAPEPRMRTRILLFSVAALIGMALFVVALISIPAVHDMWSSAAAQPSCRRLHSRFRLAPGRVAEWATPGNRTAGTHVSETDPTDLCGRHCGWRICQRPQSRARNARPPWSVQFSDRGPILAADFDHR
jgi:hypothetical protein